MKENKRGYIGDMLLLLCAFTLFSSSVMVVGASTSTPSTIKVTYTLPTPQVTKTTLGDQKYDQVTLENAPSVGSFGEPRLPAKGAYILLPMDTTVDTITVVGEQHLLGSGYTIVPCGEPIPLIAHPPAAQIPAPDPAIYSSISQFPGNLFTHVGTYQCKGFTIAVLTLYPIQYVPASGDLYYYSDMTVTVTVKNTMQKTSMFRGLPDDFNTVRNKVDNSELLDTYQIQSAPLEEYDLLILTTDALKSGFEPLANDHTAAGQPTIVKTLTEIGATTPEQIRDYIRTAYQTWGIKYVLLGGGGDVVTEKILWVEGMDEGVNHYEDFMPADHYYACLDGTYNYDGDEKWGEPTDGEGGADVDLMAEVYVGRACVGSTNEVANFVGKTRAYLALSEAAYLKKASFVGEYLGDYGVASFGGNYLDQMIDGSSADGYTTVGISSTDYTIDTLYDRDWPGFDPNNPWNTGWPPVEIENRINQGVHIINHLGHSSYGYNMRLENNDVAALSNNDYGFIYSQGCMAGGFDNPEGYDCIAEHFTVKTPSAAFAGIWNARYGFFWSYSTDGDSQRIQRQYWDAIFGENLPQIGYANHDSKEDNLFIIGRSCIRWVYYETNLFGDPILTFHEPGPAPELEISTVKGGFGKVSANLLNSGTLPAENIEWTITVQGGLLKRINVTTTGVISLLDIDSNTNLATDELIFGLGNVTITITALYCDKKITSGFVLGPLVLKVV